MQANGILGNREFLKLWVSQIFSYLGDAIVQVAMIAYVMSLTDTAGPEMAKILFFFLLPSFLFSPIAGICADKFSRKNILLTSALYRTVLVVAITCFASTVTSGLVLEQVRGYVYAFSFLLGIGTAFFYPAKQSIIPNLVESANLQKANAINAGTTTIVIMIGAIITGLTIDKFGLVNCLSINAVTFAVAGMFALWINVASTGTTARAAQDFKGFSLASYLNTHRRTLRYVILAVFLALITSTFYNSLNALAADYFKIGIAGISKLKGMLGAGTLVGTLLALSLNKRFKMSYLLAGAFTAICLATATAPVVNTYSLAWFWLVTIGASNAIIVITLDTILQKVTPDKLRGKIFGLKSTIGTLAFLTATWTVSEVLKVTTPLNTFKVVALMCIGVAIATLVYERSFLQLVLRTISKSLMYTFFNIQIEGEEYLKSSDRMILAGNHTGWLDTVVLTAACRRPIRFMAGELTFRLPVVREIAKLMGIIPVLSRKGHEALDMAVNCLDKGDIIGIFPEGRLTLDGKLNRFRKGFAYIHKNSGAPVVPFVIHGGFEAWSCNQILPKPYKITIQFGQPIKDFDGDENELSKELQNRVQFMKLALERRHRQDKNEDFYKNILRLSQFKSDIHGAEKALSLKEKHGWSELSYIELSRQAKNFSNYVIEQGVQRGDRFAILSESRPEWGIAFFASFGAGTITVPLDIKLTIAELTSILSDCRPRVLCVSNHYLDKARELQVSIDSIEQIYVLDAKKETDEFPSIYEVKGPGGDIGRERALEETALIVYTSGTTGNPKGVMISFGNIISQLKDFEEVFKMNPSDSLVSILPLNHLLELTVGFLGTLNNGAKISYSKSLNPKEISRIMQEKQVTYLITVPLFLKMLKNSVDKELKKQKGLVKKIFDFSYALAAYVPFNSVKRFMFTPVHRQFGGKMKGFVCGGAPLDKDVAEFFDRIGMPAYQGYGLTETSPTITTNTPKYNRSGSVGKPLPSVTVKIAENGEILAKGPNVMQGYYNKPEMTAEVIDADGWFHTGDIGEFDADGFLYITGRIKNMIVLGGGKKIFPEEVEAVLERSEMVKELCVLSVKIQGGNKDGTEEVGAVIVPSDALQKQYENDPAGLQKGVEDELNALADNLAPYKRPTSVFIHLEELPKTATRKVKRRLVQEWIENRTAINV